MREGFGMSRFMVSNNKNDNFYWEIMDTYKDRVVCEHISRIELLNIAGLLNQLNGENEQLKKSEKLNKEHMEYIIKKNKELQLQKNELSLKNQQLQSKLNSIRKNIRG